MFAARHDDRRSGPKRQLIACAWGKNDKIELRRGRAHALHCVIRFLPTGEQGTINRQRSRAVHGLAFVPRTWGEILHGPLFMPRTWDRILHGLDFAPQVLAQILHGPLFVPRAWERILHGLDFAPRNPSEIIHGPLFAPLSPASWNEMGVVEDFSRHTGNSSGHLPCSQRCIVFADSKIIIHNPNFAPFSSTRWNEIGTVEDFHLPWWNESGTVEDLRPPRRNEIGTVEDSPTSPCRRRCRRE